MSQEKVDRYKKEKANRQAIMKKEKRKTRFSITAVFAVIIALAVWFGCSVYQNSKTVETVTYSADYTALEDFLSNFS